MPIIAGHTFTVEQYRAIRAQFEADKAAAIRDAGVSLEAAAQRFVEWGMRTDAEVNGMDEAAFAAAFPIGALRRAG